MNTKIHESIIMTPEQQRRLAEFDDTERILQKHLKELHERRREYINTNQLNEKVGTTK